MVKIQKEKHLNSKWKIYGSFLPSTSINTDLFSLKQRIDCKPIRIGVQSTRF